MIHFVIAALVRNEIRNKNYDLNSLNMNLWMKFWMQQENAKEKDCFSMK